MTAGHKPPQVLSSQPTLWQRYSSPLSGSGLQASDQRGLFSRRFSELPFVLQMHKTSDDLTLLCIASHFPVLHLNTRLPVKKKGGGGGGERGGEKGDLKIVHF